MPKSYLRKKPDMLELRRGDGDLGRRRVRAVHPRRPLRAGPDLRQQLLRGLRRQRIVLELPGRERGAVLHGCREFQETDC